MLDVVVTDGVAVLTLDRPEIHNAFDDHLIATLTARLIALQQDPGVRALVLTGRGQSFSAGGDLSWMRRMAGYGPDENLEDARGLARLMAVLDRMPKPTIARVNGSAFAGGLGLIACCDIAIGIEGAQFAVTEVRIGLIPAVICPYLVRAMGSRATRRLSLTAERFDAAEALRLGLLHQIVPADRLDGAVDAVLADLKKASPAALAAAKDLIAAVDRPLDDDVIDMTARRIATIRSSPEGREGVSAFLDKRKPDWGKSS